jgi:hypothetical protein
MGTLLGTLLLLLERYSFFVGLKKRECPVDAKKAVGSHFVELEYDDAKRGEWQSVELVCASQVRVTKSAGRDAARSEQRDQGLLPHPYLTQSLP